jgi:hypothetical protein
VVGYEPRRGSIELADGTRLDLAGWINEGKPGSKIEGQKYIKGTVTLPWKPTAPAPSPTSSVHGDDDISWD